MMTWISEQAKWVIYIFIVFILAGLLFMDMSQLQTDKTPPVVTFGDEESITLADYQARLQETQSRMAGQNLTDEQNAQMRQELLNQLVLERLQSELIESLQLMGSDVELWADLRNEPIPGVERAPVFQSVNGTDTIFDPAKYKAWLDTSIAGTITDPQLIQYREYLRTQKVPQRQLQMLVMAGYHPSTLESRWQVGRSQTRFDLLVATLGVDSIASPSVDSLEIKKYFEAHPDSFFIAQDLAKADVVILPIQPSNNDVKSAQEWAQMLINQIQDGADFAELAKLNSDDSASAAQGGTLVDAAAWGGELAATLSTLDSGKVAALPVRSMQGFHIVQSLGKKDTTGISARHILVRVTAGTETVDSLVNVLKGVKEQVESGKSLVEATSDLKLGVQRTEWLGKSSTLPGVGFLQGFSSYLFRNPEANKSTDKTSAILQNKVVVALALKVDSLEAGTRVLEPYKSYIQGRLAQEKRVEIAKASLEQQTAALATFEAQATDSAMTIPGNIQLRKVSGIGFEGFIPGLGYASPEVYRVLSKQSAGQWGSAVVGQGSAVKVKVLAKVDADPAAVEAQASTDMQGRWQYGTYSLFTDYLKNLQQGAGIVSNLDLYYNE